MTKKISEASLLNLKKGCIYQVEVARNKYYENPPICKNCGIVIELKGRAPSEARRRKFCSRSCASRYRMAGNFSTKEKELYCTRCGGLIQLSSRKGRNGAYLIRKVCDDCLSFLKDGELTKAKLKEKTKKHGYYGFRGRINRHANKIYDRSGGIRECKVCRFNIHVDICHIKDVADFPETALIKEINHIDNLVALCPNHHVMFDKKLIDL